LKLAGGPSTFQQFIDQPNLGYQNLSKLQRFVNTDQQARDLADLVYLQVLQNQQTGIRS